MPRAAEIFEDAHTAGRTHLLEPEAKMVCKEYGIPVTKFFVAKTLEQALSSAEEIGFPLVLKIISPQVVHKSDVGGVVAGIYDRGALKTAYQGILASVKERSPNAEISGMLVEELAPPSTEVIVGSTKDPEFGVVLMFGLGGIFVEVLKDVTFRAAPITASDAREMLTDLKGYPILKGSRGRPPTDIEGLVEILLHVSTLVTDHPEIKELDLNPIIAYSKGAKTVDARITLE